MFPYQYPNATYQNAMATDEEVGRYYDVTERLRTRNYFNSLSMSNSNHNGCLRYILARNDPQSNYTIQMTTFGQISPGDRDAIRRTVKTELPGLEKRLKEEKTKEKEKERQKEERKKEESKKRAEEEAKKRVEADAKIRRYRVSDELALFLGKPSGSKMLLKEALREIEQYIVTKKLHKQNGRVIILDFKLASLLKLKRNDELIQKKFVDLIVLSPHFAEERRAVAKERERKEFEERLKKEEKEKRYQEFKSKRLAHSNIAAEIVNYVPFYPLVVATPI
jgi:chromatin remodeling complex protein RSC6